mmetsp:Transcript_7134/g.10093  ORF Transcript_7134/g.10093 Transcript_7134/m.10093 type:complete len:557 (-) Transcript_7134:1095-2765(-)
MIRNACVFPVILVILVICLNQCECCALTTKGISFVKPTKLPLRDAMVCSPLRKKEESQICRRFCISSMRGLHMSSVTQDSLAENGPRRFRFDSYVLSQAALIGFMTGWAVSVFKLAVDAVKRSCYGTKSILAQKFMLRPLIPALGGLLVGLLGLVGSFSPGIAGVLKEVDDETMMEDDSQSTQSPLCFIRKALSAIVTLGTGCSLGPEGPSVEVGMQMARIAMNVSPANVLFRQNSKIHEIRRKRLLLSCGAAAGVAAGFEAPLAGVFFALEIVQASFPPIPVSDGDIFDDSALESSLLFPTRNIGALLLSSVLAALNARSLLGKHTMFTVSEYHLRTPLHELPLYLLLGSLAGVVAFVFKETTSRCQSFFRGDLGPEPLRRVVSYLPNLSKPMIGGLLCGVCGLFFPQILFLGYETHNSLLANSSLPTTLLISLLALKTIMTSISAGSGLVGGTFAPSLLLGALLGGSFHNIVSGMFHDGVAAPLFQLADVPAYAMVGSGSVLAALFRAPITASLLMFELTRDYDVILPLMASAAVGSVVSDIIESKFAHRDNSK